ncbi:twin-arginine translocase TatA/TatE family subunit [Microbacterium allomyrinae]|uniref:Sec-independent protein translocase protein TatA n=1 Tax=Microbacterium allomyrinae TaxID=2830666 RepID=A0A9X1S474_9MICO|nr:twin-arginine translocase TatA/TatE family subunit [Microbacterium allomyrinae]MCC2032758.1 twin-arginine translocase TatA/TatE family subunit [Microbacterium allomyrinae]
MFANLNGWHLLILLAVVVLLFGAAKLPNLAKSVGQSARILKGEMKAMKSADPVESMPVSSSPRPTGIGVESTQV